MTLAQLARLVTDAETWRDPLAAAMMAHWINTQQREAFFVATCLHESDGFRALSENMNYTARGILRMWGSRFSTEQAREYAAQPERIANRAYANRNGNGDEDSGDGWLYRARGLIGITGKRNYMRAEAATGIELVGSPELLEDPLVATEVSAWFWSDAGCNEVADQDDFDGTQGIINRGSRAKTADNLKARNAWLTKVIAALSS